MKSISINIEKRRYHFLFIKCTMLFLICFTGQLKGQDNYCSTLSGPNILAGQNHFPSIETPVNIRLYFHVLRKSDGSEGVSEAQVNESFELLNSYFNPHDIYFLWDCGKIFYHDDDGYYDLPESNYCSIMQESPHEDGVDIYIGPDIVSLQSPFGKAETIPGKKLIVAGSLFSSTYSRSPVIAHEMGHALGLYYTFHGTVDEGSGMECGIPVGDPTQCCECADGSSGDDCGDYVEDTKADIYDNGMNWNAFTCEPNFTVLDNCSGCTTQNYNPNNDNFMSYNRITCLTSFTPGQVTRMFDCLSNPLLGSIIVDDNALVLTQELIGAPCPSENFEIIYELCSIAEQDIDVTLIPTLVPANPGITFGGDFLGGSYSTTVDENCISATLLISLDNTIQVGDQFEITMAVQPAPVDILVTRENCGITEITVGPDASFTVTEIGPCLYQFTSNMNGGDHLWNFGDGMTSTEVSPIHQYFYLPIPDLFFEVTHLVSSACGDDFVDGVFVQPLCQELMFECKTCPEGGDALKLGIPGVTTKASDYSSMIPPQFTGCLSIAGNFIIDLPLIFNGADVFLETDAVMEIETGVNVLFSNSHLRGCVEMWEGIFVNDGGTLLLKNGTIIEDARSAVFARLGAILDIQNTTFDRNLISIKSESQFTLQPFYGNVFDCTTPLSPPLAGQFAEAGIHVTNGNLLSIGVEGAAPTLFQNLNNGIIANLNSLMVQNCTFTNIKQQGTDNYPVMGYGIRSFVPNWGSSYTLTQKGHNTPGSIGAVSFQDCTTGIYARAVALTVSDNNMTGMMEGVISEVATQKVVVRNNVIDCEQMGIQMSMSDPNISNRTILFNTVTIDGEGDAILVNGSGILVNKPKPIYIRDNTINVHSANPDLTNGIHVNSIAGVHVLGNVIELGSVADKVSGIKLDNANLGKIESNQVTGLNATGKAAGMWAFASPSNLWECNSVADMYYGIRIDGVSNTPGMFSTNDMEDNEIGLLMKEGGRIGGQFQTGNKWLGSFNNTLGAARHEGTLDDINASRFFANDNSSTYWPSSIVSISPWFFGNNSISMACGISDPCNGCEFTMLDNVTDSADDLIAANGQPTTDAIKWQSERYLYGKLKRHASLAAPGSVLETFFNNQLALTVGQFSNVSDGIGVFYSIDEVSNALLELQLEELETKMDTIRILDNLLLTATSNESISILATRAQVMQEIATLSANNASLVSLINSNRMSGATVSGIVNGAVPVPEVYEQNEQSVNGIFLNALAQGTINFTANEVLTLQSIANQCPLEGGNGVFKARSLMTINGLHAMYDDDDTCLPVGQRGQEGEESVEVEMAFRLFPNPASEKVKLEWNAEGNTAEPMELNLFDALGNLIFSNELPVGQNSFVLSTGNFAAGIYVLEVYKGGNRVHAEKLILME